MAPKKPKSSPAQDSFIKEPAKKRLTILARFVDRIRSTFQRFQSKPLQEHPLVGRIQDLQSKASAVLIQLQSIKNELHKEIDAEAFVYIEEVIDPLIKEVSRLHKSIEQPRSVLHQAKTYQRYSQWVEKAKLWIQICSKTTDKEALFKAVIRYTIDEFLEVIDRDVQVITDYQEHMLEALSIDEEEKIDLAQRLEVRLQSYLHALNALRVKPENLPLKEIAVWKAQVDKRREKYFDAALHAIDKIVNQSLPDSRDEEENEDLKDALIQIAYLEKHIPPWYDEINLAETLTFTQKADFKSQLELWEQKIHRLNLDLRLTPELIERLKTLNEIIHYAQHKLMP
ncbi:hypothetical protein DB41_ET00050 [Neochlamydia sp. TUME1]|uniref:hypothetical protein n=1 Tax=Neochlamydia sp. TUME1 TaxID=1478174 RepID=UPI00057DF02A|nr:hypothetical protein [Neochlamydia sp. TUME1]KIC76735.1 hypothetical protein DB41_ET00050 [Neochlamydia sp. TUME1]